MVQPLLSLPFWSPADIQAAVRPVVAHLGAHGVLAYPTETVYGFGTATDHESVESLVRLKGRPPSKPFLLLINGSGMLDHLGLVLTATASRFAARFWPGPLTLVLPGGDHRVPNRLRGPNGGVAVRWTPHPAVQQLLQAFGEPITSTSANRPGVPPATTASDVVSQWTEAIHRGALLVLDGGALPPSQPSTVVDCTGPFPRVVRVGAIAVDALRECVPEVSEVRT